MKILINSKLIATYQTQQRVPDFRRYEILVLSEVEAKDHLGNVRTVISDVKNPYIKSGAVSNWTYLADVKNISNMYPYGKSYGANATYDRTDDYRYGFNGMEKEKNFSETGDITDFGARFLDSEFPTFGKRDPKEWKYPGLSSFSTFGGNPIRNIDPDGQEYIAMNKYTETKAIEYLEEEYKVKNLFYFETIDDDENGVSELQINEDVYDKNYDSFSPEIKEEIDAFREIIESDKKIYAKFSKDKNLDFFWNKEIKYRTTNKYGVSMLARANVFGNAGLRIPLLETEGITLDFPTNSSMNPNQAKELNKLGIVVMNIGMSETGTFNAINGGQTLPCASCVFIHENLDHILDFVRNGTINKSPDEKPGQGTKYHDKSLKRKNSPTRIDHDDK